MPEIGQTWVPTLKEVKTMKHVLSKFDYCLKLRNKKYPILGDRTPAMYWTESEKRFTCFAPPKDITEEDWQANVVMGLTRNAVLSQVSKTGLKVPMAHVQDWTKNGFMDTERSRIWQNVYKWSLRREDADTMQQFVALGNYVRGNACLYEGFEDRETEVEIVEETDFETGEVKTKKEKISAWGPRRQVVPLTEVYYPNFFKNNLKTQSYVVWARSEDYDSLKAECEGYKNWKKVKPSIWNVPAIDDPFFKPRTLLGSKHVFVIRYYGNPHEGGEDRFILLANGVPLIDQPLPFNHKRPPFAWALNEPFTDAFMLGCSVPFKMMDQQDSSDSLMNMGLDKNALSMQKPVMTDDPDVRVDNFLTPGAIMKFSKGSTYQMAPIEGVTSGEFNFMNMVVNQAKEFSGAYGGAASATSKGGKITARQAMMQEEEVKRQLGISMKNLEAQERDICILRLQNLKQFLPGSGKRIEAQDAALSTDFHGGKRGRFVAILAKNAADAQKMENDAELSMLEIAGQKQGIPTEAVAITPDWFDETDRLEASVISDSSYQDNTTLEQAVADQRMQMLIQMKQFVPSINVEEILRENMETHGEDTSKFLSAQPPAPPPGQGGPGGPGSPPGGPPQGAGGQGGAPALSSQIGGNQSLNSLLGM